MTNNPNLLLSLMLLSLMVHTTGSAVPIVQTTAATPQVTCGIHARGQALLLRHSKGALHARYCCLFFR